MSTPAALPAEEFEPRAERLLTRLTIGVGAIVVALLIRRLPYGVDLADESFYVAMPYRFFMGDRPFVDEVLLHQTAALITYPLIAAFVKWTGSSDGIVLFMRNAHLVFSLCFSAVAGWVFSHFVRWQYATLIGLACAAFVPFCIPNLSYNTMGISFFTCGVLLGSLSVGAPSSTRIATLGGGFLGLAMLAYPPLGLPAAAHVVAAFALTRRENAGRSAALAYGGSAFIAGLCVAAFLASFGIDNIARCIATTAVVGTKGGGFEKLSLLASDVFYWVVLQPVPLAIAATLWWGTRSKHSAAARWLPGLALLMPLTLDSVDYWMDSRRGLFQVLHLALAAPLLANLGSFSASEKRFATLVMLASAVAAPLMAYTSSNGLMNAGVATLPAALIGVLALVRVVQDNFADQGGTPVAALLPCAPAIAFLFILVSTYSTTTYSSTVPMTSHLIHQLKTGPFAGMYTYWNRGLVIEGMQRDLDKHATAEDTILFFNDLPAGYMMTSARAAAHSTWTTNDDVSEATPQALFDYYEREGLRPTLLMYRAQNTKSAKAPLLEWARREYDVIERRPGHILFRARRG